MERVLLKQLNVKSRSEVISFLKKLWNQEKTNCPICGIELELLHKRAKKSACDWQCKRCNKIFKIIHLLSELNEQIPN